jgi:hypothetical protein
VGFIGIPVVLAFFGPVAAGLYIHLYNIPQSRIFLACSLPLETLHEHGMSALPRFREVPWPVGLDHRIYALADRFLSAFADCHDISLDDYLGTFIIGLAFDFTKDQRASFKICACHGFYTEVHHPPPDTSDTRDPFVDGQGTSSRDDHTPLSPSSCRKHFLAVEYGIR